VNRLKDSTCIFFQSLDTCLHLMLISMLGDPITRSLRHCSNLCMNLSHHLWLDFIEGLWWCDCVNILIKMQIRLQKYTLLKGIWYRIYLNKAKIFINLKYIINRRSYGNACQKWFNFASCIHVFLLILPCRYSDYHCWYFHRCIHVFIICFILPCRYLRYVLFWYCFAFDEGERVPLLSFLMFSYMYLNSKLSLSVMIMCKEATIMVVLFFLLLATGVGANKFDFYPLRFEQ